MLDLGGRPDGAVSADGRIVGCYVHGLFAADGVSPRVPRRACARAPPPASPTSSRSRRTLDALADHLEAAVDVEGLLALAARAER